MFRLAETLRVADPAEIERKLPPALIADWFKYFHYKDNRFDKLEFYLWQLSVLIAAIGGNKDPDALKYPRANDQRAAAAKSEKVTPEVLEKLLRAAFGV